MDTVEIFLEVERTFGIELPEEASAVGTIGDIADVVVAEMDKAGGSNREYIQCQIKFIVGRQLGIKQDTLTPSDRLIEDLGAE
jgi:hypothetical protein